MIMENVNKRKGILHNKNFVLTTLGSLVSNVAAIFYNFAISFWILQVTDNNSVIQGLYLGLTGLFFVLASPIGGVIVDKFHKGKIIWFCDFLRGGLILLTFLLFLLIPDNTAILVILFISGCLGNIIGAIFVPAGSALIPEVVEKENLQKANSINGIGSAIQMIIGTTLVGLLYSVLTMKFILLMVGCLYVASAISEIFIKYNYQKKEQKINLKIIFSDTRETFKYIKKENTIFMLLLLTIILNLFFNPFQSNFLPYFCLTDLAGKPFLLHEIFQPEIWQTIFCLCISICSIITALIFSKKQIRDDLKVMKIGFILIAISMTGIALSYFFLVSLNDNVNPFLIICSGLSCLIGISIITINVPASSILQKTIVMDKFGKVMSLLQLGAQGLTPIMVFVSGYIIEAGTSYLLFVLAGGLILTTLLALIPKSLRKNGN